MRLQQNDVIAFCKQIATNESQLKLGLIIIKLPGHAMFPFTEYYVFLEVINKLTRTSQQKVK